MSPTRYSLLLICLTLGLCGCPLVDTPKPLPPKPDTVSPTPLVNVDARKCLDVYAFAMAATFENSADQFDAHVPGTTIVKDMGDALVTARVDAFMPLMKSLVALNPRPGATDAQRAEAYRRQALVLREWAKQLKGVQPDGH